MLKFVCDLCPAELECASELEAIDNVKPSGWTRFRVTVCHPLKHSHLHEGRAITICPECVSQANMDAAKLVAQLLQAQEREAENERLNCMRQQACGRGALIGGGIGQFVG